MTVSSTTNKSGPYLGNGSTVDFDYEFRILDPSHLTVIRTEDGVDTPVAPSDFTVSGVGASSGGALTFLVAPVTGQSITIIRNAPFTQPTDLENQGAYYAETVEAALDLGVMRDQQLAEGLSRAVQIPVGADAGALTGLIEDIVRLSDSADQIDTVAGIAANVTTVAGISANVTTVAGIAADVTTIAEVRQQIVDIAENGVAGASAVVASGGSAAISLSDRFKQELTPYDFGAVGDGVTNDTAALDAWGQAVIDLGVSGFCPAGKYRMATGVALALTQSASFRIDGNAEFVAAVGFDGRLFQFDTSTAPAGGMVFEWEGGQYDGTNMANSDPGEANDVFDFFDNSAKCDHVKIHLDRVVTGDSWLDGGSDSHLFVAGSKSIDVSIAYSRGAVDAGIYISGNQSGANGKNLKLFINAERAAVAAIVKRLFETADVKVQALECLNGGAAGLADGDLGSGSVMVASGFHMNFDVMARRCENALNVQAVPGVSARVNAYEMGIAIPGYTSTAAVGASISGSSKGFYEVNCHDVNPGCVVSAVWRAVVCSRRLVDVTNYDATDNLVLINSSGFGVSFFEDANADRNRFVVKESGQVAASAVVGTQSSAMVSTPLAGWGLELNDNTVSIGGARNTEGLRVTKTANSVNFLHAFGAVAGGVPVIGFTGTDADVPGVISTKGLGRMLLGGGVGLESLSIAKVASQVNAAEIVGAISASKPILRVRGADADIGLTIRPKGTGAVDISDNAGNKRIEVNATGLGFFGTTPVAAKTGWAVPTGTFTRTTFVTGSVTLPQLAERVAALIQDLHQTAGYGVLRT